MSFGFRVESEFKNLVFAKREKSKDPEKFFGARKRTENLIPLMTGLDSNSGKIGGRCR